MTAAITVPDIYDVTSEDYVVPLTRDDLVRRRTCGNIRLYSQTLMSNDQRLNSNMHYWDLITAKGEVKASALYDGWEQHHVDYAGGYAALYQRIDGVLVIAGKMWQDCALVSFMWTYATLPQARRALRSHVRGWATPIVQ